jgi:hypothetical protein
MVTSQRPRTGERHGSALESTRRGAHRARPGPLTAVLPTLAVLVVVLVAVVVMFQLFSGNGGAGDDGQAVPDPGQDQVASSTPSPSASAQPSPSAPAASADTTVDHKAAVIVLNNTGKSGQGKRASTKLKETGWTVSKIGNLLPRNQVTATTVFYASPDQKATAEAISKDIGVGVASQSAHMAAAGITLVLAADYTG